jgi:hypothetical protein
MFVVCLRTEIHVSGIQLFLNHHHNENQSTFSHSRCITFFTFCSNTTLEKVFCPHFRRVCKSAKEDC